MDTGAPEINGELGFIWFLLLKHWLRGFQQADMESLHRGSLTSFQFFHADHDINDIMSWVFGCCIHNEPGLQIMYENASIASLQRKPPRQGQHSHDTAVAGCGLDDACDFLAQCHG